MSDNAPRSVVAPFGSGADIPRTSQHYLTADDGTKYRVEAERRGGMGIVYLCSLVDEPSGAAKLALKTFDDRFFFDARMQMAFETESGTWLAVSGAPFVMPLLEIETCENKPYLVMPAVYPTSEHSASLADEIRKSQNGLSDLKCLTYALMVAIALFQSVKRVPALVHGDIKPDNILLLNGAAYLSDFGAARLASKSGYAMNARGTAQYLAPESWRGAGPDTSAVDIYAFGVTLFEMLTGKVPFEVEQGDLEQLERMHRENLVELDVQHADIRLDHALGALALECLAKSPSDRPRSPKLLTERLVRIGYQFQPYATEAVLAMGSAQAKSFAEPEFIEARARYLLKRGDGQAAFDMLERIPEEKRVGRVLFLLGSASSLASQDEEALHYFDKYLADEHDPALRASCLNEYGLSLKRLNRLQEARELYETAIKSQSGNLLLTLCSNYADTLIRLGEPHQAVTLLRPLVHKNPEADQAWGILSEALWQTKDTASAVDAIQRAINLAPRSGQYRVVLATYLMDGFKNYTAALEALDVAYGLGYHSRDWVVRCMACNLILRNLQDVDALYRSLEESLSKDVAESFFQEALRIFQKFVREATQNGQKANGDHAESATSPSGTDEDSAPHNAPQDDRSGGSSNRTASDAAEGYDEEKFRTGIRSGSEPYMQVRMSHVDSSTLYDFYYGTDRPDYAQKFATLLADIKAKMMGYALNARGRVYAFAECPNCSTVVLTQRDENEVYRCQGCDTRVPVTVTRNPDLDRLLSGVVSAAGLQYRELAGGTLFLGIGIKDEASRKVVSDHFSAEDYELIKHECLIHAVVLKSAHERGIRLDEFEVWMKEVPEGRLTSLEDGTPEDVDRLLRKVRRAIGHTNSVTVTSHDPEDTRKMLKSGKDLFEELLPSIDPGDTGDLRVTLELAVRFKRLDKAKELLAKLRLVNPNHPDCLAAAAAIDAAEGRYKDAIRLLESVLEKKPMDHHARKALMLAYESDGDMENAQRVFESLQAHGILRVAPQQSFG